jgi:hypothetical protein
MIYVKKKLLIATVILISVAVCLFATFLNFTPTKEIAKNDALIFDIFALVFGAVLIADGSISILNPKPSHFPR